MDGFQLLRCLKEHMDILLKERSLKTLKIPSGFSYLTLYDSPKRPIGKSEKGPKAPSVGSIQVWGPKGFPSPLQELEGGVRRTPTLQYIYISLSMIQVYKYFYTSQVLKFPLCSLKMVLILKALLNLGTFLNFEIRYHDFTYSKPKNTN